MSSVAQYIDIESMLAERKPVLALDVLLNCIVGIAPFAVPLSFRGLV